MAKKSKTSKLPFAPGKKPNIPILYCPLCQEGIYRDQFDKYSCGCHLNWTFDQRLKNYELNLHAKLLKGLVERGEK